MAYLNKEWTDYINRAVRDKRKSAGYKIYVAYGSPMWVAYKRAERELYKQTTAHKLYKVRQAWRILFKLIIRTYFKRNK